MNWFRQDGNLTKIETETFLHQNWAKILRKTENNDLENHTYTMYSIPLRNKPHLGGKGNVYA